MYIFFFFNDTPTTEIYTLSLHAALPISAALARRFRRARLRRRHRHRRLPAAVGAHARRSSRSRGGHRHRSRRQSEEAAGRTRSEEHTSELQSRQYLVCRLLLEKKQTQRS